MANTRTCCRVVLRQPPPRSSNTRTLRGWKEDKDNGQDRFWKM